MGFTLGERALLANIVSITDENVYLINPRAMRASPGA